MIAFDTNILVHAHRGDSPWHERAYACFSSQAESGLPWAIPWPCIHEFLAVSTHSRIHKPPTPLSHALEQVGSWLEAPTVRLLGASTGYWTVLRRFLEATGATGARVHDAHVAALCVHHGVSELWSADRDFNRFKELKVVNPLRDA
jgi:toxin-antitoxin system PIN domain toxin